MSGEDVYDLGSREPEHMACMDCGAQFTDPELVDDDEFGIEEVDVDQCPACSSTRLERLP